MIFLFTDFGQTGPYVGQVHAVLKRACATTPVIDLMHDAPAFDPKASAYLLSAYTMQAQAGDVVVAVVDPGVGGDRKCVVLNADGVWFVGPDNGLLSQVQRRATHTQAYQLVVPESSSATFHGRDVFAPAAAQLAMKSPLADVLAIDAAALDRPAWPDDLAEVVYIDGYGNALTGLRVESMWGGENLTVGGQVLPRARTFTDVGVGDLFWYGNSNRLVEIAQNSGNAAKSLGLRVGDRIARATPKD
jgi:hypothetical protein